MIQFKMDKSDRSRSEGISFRTSIGGHYEKENLSITRVDSDDLYGYRLFGRK